jgi:hypothetical protein
LRGFLVDDRPVRKEMQIQRIRRVPESRVQYGAKKTEVNIRLPGRAILITELRR